MLLPFLRLAMTARERQRTFRTTAALHIALAGLVSTAVAVGVAPPAALGQALLIAGIVEGATLVGWRLTQLPKSQALEFLLVSPVQPRRLFVAEALAGLGRFALVGLGGLPLAFLPLFTGRIDAADFLPITLMPLAWGAVTGLGLVTWAYEGVRTRRVGELVGLVGILVYLGLGVLAGEKLFDWLAFLPESGRWWAAELFGWLHTYNPFAVMQAWFTPDIPREVAADRVTALTAGAVGLAGLLLARAAARLKGHFHDRHYRPLADATPADPSGIRDRPLAWWAVRRVMEYSGRSNLYLAGGFGLLYAAYTVAGDAWPPWLGRMVFLVIEQAGGVPMVVSALVMLGAVPAAYQYGLWDSNAADRCRRLELLLLTRLDSDDYWGAACAAAWARGRGYLLVAGVLWAALAYSGKAAPLNVLASAVAGLLLWLCFFALGFWAFSSGWQANGLGSILTLGTPAVAFLLHAAHLGDYAALTPPGSVHAPLAGPIPAAWYFGPLLMGGLTLWLERTSRPRCDAALRRWYDGHHGVRGG